MLSDGASATAYSANIVNSILGQTGTSTVKDFLTSTINSGLAIDTSTSSNDIVTNNPGSGGLTGTNITTGVDPMLAAVGEQRRSDRDDGPARRQPGDRHRGRGRLPGYVPADHDRPARRSRTSPYEIGAYQLNATASYVVTDGGIRPGVRRM